MNYDYYLSENYAAMCEDDCAMTYYDVVADYFNCMGMGYYADWFLAMREFNCAVNYDGQYCAVLNNDVYVSEFFFFLELQLQLKPL